MLTDSRTQQALALLTGILLHTAASSPSPSPATTATITPSQGVVVACPPAGPDANFPWATGLSFYCFRNGITSGGNATNLFVFTPASNEVMAVEVMTLGLGGVVFSIGENSPADTTGTASYMGGLSYGYSTYPAAGATVSSTFTSSVGTPVFVGVQALSASFPASGFTVLITRTGVSHTPSPPPATASPTSSYGASVPGCPPPTNSITYPYAVQLSIYCAMLGTTYSNQTALWWVYTSSSDELFSFLVGNQGSGSITVKAGTFAPALPYSTADSYHGDIGGSGSIAAGGSASYATFCNTGVSYFVGIWSSSANAVSVLASRSAYTQSPSLPATSTPSITATPSVGFTANR